MTGGDRIRATNRIKNKKSSSSPNPRHAPRSPMASGIPLSLSRHGHRRLIAVVSLALIASILILSFTPSDPRPPSIASLPSVYTARVVNEFPHDPRAFTQGILYAGNDTLFESTGLHGRSSVRKVALQSGKVEILQIMDKFYFGEGLTLLGERLYQVAWMTNDGFIYDRNNLSKISKFTHQMKDGWGLATDGKILFGTDGTSMLYHIDPQTMEVIQNHTVNYKGHEVHNLNELEFVNGEVWANVWQTDCIARISRDDGSVLGWVILPELRRGLLRAGERHIDVLNGIAWDEDKERLFVTGKLWPKLYEIKVQPLKKGELGVEIEKLCITMPFKF